MLKPTSTTKEKLLKTGDFIISILFFINILIFIGSLTILFYNIFLPIERFSDINSVYDINPLSIGVFTEFSGVNLSLFSSPLDIKTYFILGNIFSTLYLLPIIAVMFFVKKLSTSTLSGNIFTAKSSRNILFITVFSAISMFLSVNASSFFSLVFIEPFSPHLIHAVNAPLESIKGGGFTFDLYSFVILTALVCIYYAFKRGEELQKLSDETI